MADGSARLPRVQAWGCVRPCLVVAVLLLGGGCGGGDDGGRSGASPTAEDAEADQAAVAAVEGYVSAMAAGNGDAAMEVRTRRPRTWRRSTRRARAWPTRGAPGVATL